MPTLNIATAILSWILLTTLPPLFLLPSQNSTISIILPLLFFNNLNILIALCEICLGKHITYIQSDYLHLQKKYSGGNEWSACVAYLTTPLPIKSLFDGKIWSRMWSTYALYDPSYQNNESFGFFIDVGNGWSTIPPCLLLNAAMVVRNFEEFVEPLWVGVIGVACYWQVMYGTVIYLLSFVFNRRWEGKKGLGGVLAFVGVSNSLWFFFPILGIWVCVQILREGSFIVFRM